MADVTTEAVSAVVGRVYEAAYDQERWFDAVTSLRDLFGGSRACILHVSPRTAKAVASDLDPELSSQKAIDTLMRDPLTAASAALPVGKVYRWPPPPDEPAFRRSELWQDWLRPRDIYKGLACNLIAANGSHWILSVDRGPRQDAFGKEDIELLQKIVPHVLRAGQIGRRLENTSALASAFARLPFGVLLVNGHCQIAQMNEAAEAILARRDSPLTLKDGTIVATGVQDTQELQRLVVDACSLVDGVMRGTGGTLLVPSDRQRSDLARLVLSVASFVDARAYSLASERCAMIMMTEVACRIPDGFEMHVHGLEDGAHEPEHFALLDRLRPDMARASLAATRLGLERARGTVNALATIGLPAAVLAGNGRVRATNTLFDQEKTLFVATAFGGIALANPESNRLFQMAVQARDGEPVSRSIPLRSALPPPVVVHVLPLKRDAHDLFGGCDLLIVATAISASALVPSPTILTGLFDLTAAEVRLATALAKGLNLQAAAAEAGLQFSTVRTYLNRIFRKTGTNQQSQLVALLKSAHPFQQ
ncbi:hypothetical protein EN949_11405 [Mesorhizobium sp. M7A.F.Ca.US.007.01.2.1]|uniref:helix-turn-helix transcriptional regulator n=4 Tax=unclassified Mesorhizobium TaxID=325217 RepID=UPI000FCC1065|nr:hypothetical protein [Mesorhizobium sp. M7A.F.Ca.US.007.01.2.1]RUZ26880.1 hypothetical protein EN949_11405 [Mesorhizobium sp. M7A.F.Ca.US.007.01.2.1]